MYINFIIIWYCNGIWTVTRILCSFKLYIRLMELISVNMSLIHRYTNYFRLSFMLIMIFTNDSMSISSLWIHIRLWRSLELYGVLICDDLVSFSSLSKSRWDTRSTSLGDLYLFSLFSLLVSASLWWMDSDLGSLSESCSLSAYISFDD